MCPALVVALGPPRALAQPGPDRPHPLLRDPGRPAEPDAPAVPGEGQAEVEVLGEAVRPRRPAEREQGRDARELPVAAEADRADAIPCRLREVAEPDELHVLAALEQ